MHKISTRSCVALILLMITPCNVYWHLRPFPKCKGTTNARLLKHWTRVEEVCLCLHYLQHYFSTNSFSLQSSLHGYQINACVFTLKTSSTVLSVSICPALQIFGGEKFLCERDYAKRQGCYNDVICFTGWNCERTSRVRGGQRSPMFKGSEGKPGSTA